MKGCARFCLSQNYKYTSKNFVSCGTELLEAWPGCPQTTDQDLFICLSLMEHLEENKGKSMKIYCLQK